MHVSRFRIILLILFVFQISNLPTVSFLDTMSQIENQSPTAENKNKDKIMELLQKSKEMKITNNNSNEAEDKLQVIEAPERTFKHPLKNAWTLWLFSKDKTKTWEENQRPIITVTTVEDFWSLYNRIEVASRLPPGSDYSFFKEGIFPDWEDPKNQKGGRWIIQNVNVDYLDTCWLEIIFFMIGEVAGDVADQVILYQLIIM